MFEITWMTFITLGVLLIASIYFVVFLFNALGKHDNIKYSTLDKPLKNKGKPWYNK
jgi:hypothetical protein